MGIEEKWKNNNSLYYHKTAVWVGEEFWRRERQVEDEFSNEFLRLGHGSGNTNWENPETFEQTQDVEVGVVVVDNEILDRQMEVKGDS